MLHKTPQDIINHQVSIIQQVLLIIAILGHVSKKMLENRSPRVSKGVDG